MTGRNDPCPCGSGSKYKKCCLLKGVAAKPFDILAREYKKKYRIKLKTTEEIAGIRAACKLAGNILDQLCHFAKEGVTTAAINELAKELTAKAGATSAAYRYGNPPFPGHICTSLNEVICHGIPDNVPLKKGDILNIDYACILNSYFGDCSRMVIIGETTPERKLVVDTAYECLMEAIKVCKPGVLIEEIGNTITAVAKKNGCSVVYQFVAHGVGIDFHEEPQITHHQAPCAIPMAEGMTFTIEPMINAGEPDATIDPKDHWTARTIDGRPSAQWEHTLLITPNGHEILTLPDSN